MRASSVKFHFGLHMPVVLRTVLIAVLAVGLAAGIFFGVRGCSSGTGSLADGGTVISGANPSDQFYAMGQVFLAFDGSYARAYDVKKGELLWERSPDGSQGYQCDTSAQLGRFTRAARSMSTTRRAAWLFR